MATRFRQILLTDQQLQDGIPKLDVPQLAPFAEISLSPDDLAKRLNIQFQDSFDDVDRIAIAVLELDSGKRVSLMRPTHHPTPVTLIHVVWPDIYDLESRRSILEALGLTRDDLSWEVPYLDI